MPKVERAIIMAAGLGNRMHPVTLTTPKPLLKWMGRGWLIPWSKDYIKTESMRFMLLLDIWKSSLWHLKRSILVLSWLKILTMIPVITLHRFTWQEITLKMRLFWMAIRLFIILKSLHRNLNALDITVFGQMVKRMSGCRLLRMALLRLAAGQVGKADGSCTVFPAGRQRMGKGWNTISKLSLNKRRIGKSTGMMWRCSVTRRSINWVSVLWIRTIL